MSPPSHQKDLLSSIEVPAPIPTDFAASGSTVAGATEDLPSSKGAAPSFASSFLEANGIAPNFTKTVAVDMAGGNFSLPFGFVQHFGSLNLHQILNTNEMPA